MGDRTGGERAGAPTTDLIALAASSSAVAGLARDLESRARVCATGAVGSSTSIVAGAVARLLSRPVLLVTAHLDDAEEVRDELEGGVPVIRVPALEALGPDATIDLHAARLSAIRRILGLDPGVASVVVAPIQALMQSVPAAGALGELSRVLRRGEPGSRDGLVRWLAEAGYQRLEAIEEPGDFAVRGGIVDVFGVGGSEGSAFAARVEYFGDTVESIAAIDVGTMGSDRALDEIEIVCRDAARLEGGDSGVSVLEMLTPRAAVLVAETQEVVEQGRGYFERVIDARGIFGPPAVLMLLGQRFWALAEMNQFSSSASSTDRRAEIPVGAVPSLAPEARDAVRELGALTAGAEPHDVTVLCQSPGELQRFQELAREFAPGARLPGVLGYLHRGFVWQADEGPARLVLPYHELLHRYHTRRRGARLRPTKAADAFFEFQPGDYVVHADHGIARFVGLSTMRADGKSAIPTALRGKASAGEAQEYLTLEFAGRAKLHVPATQIDLVQRYVGGFQGKPPLSTMGGQKWKSQKAKVFESVKDLAAELLRVRAARESSPGIRYPADTAWQLEFEAEFPYEDTDDQRSAMSAIKRDMQADRPMDRLICGDVGFGKTELAIRAAFKACEYGKQVAVLVPTTVLAEQHERTFRARFADYPFRVESLSRFKTQAEANQTLAAVRKGQVDVVIGTHRILSEDVRFADLGLVVVDEEQRFGVEHKERLLRLRLTVDVLTLSATPIPRTLNMALLGLRDISSLATAPLDRRAIVTEVIPFNEKRIAQAIARELSREGQVYFVHNRVHDIRTVADRVRRLAPGARIVVGHGQMPPAELEEVMLKFMRRQADILVATTIIESGIDNPTANTLIVNDADRFGLADLHQLRGRVGRSKHRAYAYFLLPSDRNPTEVAVKRLRAIEEYSMLGAGFKIAMRDLEIRGAGNLLGAEQSGHIAAVGYDMFCQLLERAVKELKNEPVSAPASTVGLDIGLWGTIPKGYIASDQRRMEAYRRIAAAGSRDELSAVERDLSAAYGAPPEPTRRLLDLAELRVLCAGLSIRSIAIRGPDVLLRTDQPGPVSVRLGGHGPSGGASAVRVLPPASHDTQHEVYYRPPTNYLEAGTLLRVLRNRLGGAT